MWLLWFHLLMYFLVAEINSLGNRMYGCSLEHREGGSDKDYGVGRESSTFSEGAPSGERKGPIGADEAQRDDGF